MSTTPPTGTSKFLAIGNFPIPPTTEQNQAILPKQVPAVLRLYIDGKIDQFLVSSRRQRSGLHNDDRLRR